MIASLDLVAQALSIDQQHTGAYDHHRIVFVLFSLQLACVSQSHGAPDASDDKGQLQLLVECIKKQDHLTLMFWPHCVSESSEAEHVTAVSLTVAEQLT